MTEETHFRRRQAPYIADGIDGTALSLCYPWLAVTIGVQDCSAHQVIHDDRTPSLVYPHQIYPLPPLNTILFSLGAGNSSSSSSTPIPSHLHSSLTSRLLLPTKFLGNVPESSLAVMY